MLHLRTLITWSEYDAHEPPPPGEYLVTTTTRETPHYSRCADEHGQLVWYSEAGLRRRDIDLVWVTPLSKLPSPREVVASITGAPEPDLCAPAEDAPCGPTEFADAAAESAAAWTTAALAVGGPGVA